MPNATPAAQANAPQLVDIGTVAASNIVARLKLDAGKPEAEVAKTVDTVKTAIRDEIQSMSSHFTMAVADVQTQSEVHTLKLKADYEKAVADLTSSFSYVKANWHVLAVVGAVIAVVAGFVGHLL